MTFKTPLLYVYEKCSTCQESIRFLLSHDIAFEKIEITKTPPTIPELEKMLGYFSNNLKKLFNSSGLLYKELELSKKLPSMSLEEALTLLSSHGMLVKRPFLLGPNFGYVGFKEAEWQKLLSISTLHQKP